MTSAQRARDLHLTAGECGVEVGAPVLSSDNKRLGTVGDTRGPHFRVHRGFLAHDYWLDVGDIVGVFDDAIFVDFEKRAASEHRVSERVVGQEWEDVEPGDFLDETEYWEEPVREERKPDHPF
jgi:hypothetical protein